MTELTAEQLRCVLTTMSDLATLREEGWAVAVHNDYWLAGERKTFWLMTSRDGRWIKGEADNDEAALAECRKQADAWSDIHRKAAARTAELEAQLPEGMKECTILFKECEKGHGRLIAANWIDHGCHWCRLAELEAERDRLRFALDVIAAGETTNPAAMARAILSDPAGE